jgi:hypothetical protein
LIAKEKLMANEHILDEKKNRVHKTASKKAISQPSEKVDRPAIAGLQQQVGNRAVQRLLAQRNGAGSYELDEETEARINRERSLGLPLEPTLQTHMTQAIGHDFSGVRVHIDSESDSLNRQLDAKAFTAGQDIFFREGAYTPHTSSGQELIAHELTHVVQQSAGVVSGGGHMTVGAPEDVFEQQANAVAQATTRATAATDSVQCQEEEEEEDNPSESRQREALC